MFRNTVIFDEEYQPVLNVDNMEQAICNLNDEELDMLPSELRQAYIKNNYRTIVTFCDFSNLSLF